eukprot:c33234_g1_i1 orf=61-1026(+)
MYSSSHPNTFSSAQVYSYDPLHLYSRRSPAFFRSPFPHPQRRLHTQKLAYHSPKLASQLGSSSDCRSFSLDPHGVHRDSACREDFFSRRSRGEYLQHGRTYSMHVHMCSFTLQKEPNGLNARGIRSIANEKCWFFTSTDGALSVGKRRAFRQLGGMHRTSVRTCAFNPQNGGGGGGGDGGRTILNLAGAGLLTYLTVTGRLNWLFDAIFSVWLVSAVLWWFAERTLVKGPCPNCGGEFQVFEFSLKEEHRLCPYCSQPFKLENKKFVRDEPQFSNEQRRGFKQPFGGFGGFEGFGQPPSSSKKEDSSGVIVDIEAEVRDKD